MPHVALDTIGADASNIPVHTPTVGGYVTGTAGIRWTSAQFANFPHSGIIRYNQDNDPNPLIGNVFDTERNAGTVEGAAQWARGKLRLGETPRVYIQGSNLSSLESLFARLGIETYEIQVANWNLNRAQALARLGGRVKSVQHMSPSSNPHTLVPGSHLTLGQSNIDVSVCADDWFPPPVQRVRPSGEANAGLHVDLASGHWTVQPAPGTIHLGVHGTGHWDVEPLPGEGEHWCAKVRISRGDE